MTGVLYTLFVGIPFCIAMCAVGTVLCVTIIGIPLGLTCFALGMKALTLTPRTKIVVR